MALSRCQQMNVFVAGTNGPKVLLHDAGEIFDLPNHNRGFLAVNRKSTVLPYLSTTRYRYFQAPLTLI